jgi:hypothetical protein
MMRSMIPRAVSDGKPQVIIDQREQGRLNGRNLK